MDPCDGGAFYYILQDESHFLKNHKTVRSKTTIPLLKVEHHGCVVVE